MVTWLTLVIVRYSDRCIWIRCRRHRYEQIYSKDLVAASPPNVALKQKIKVLRINKITCIVFGVPSYHGST